MEAIVLPFSFRKYLRHAGAESKAATPALAAATASTTIRLTFWEFTCFCPWFAYEKETLSRVARCLPDEIL
jgi:hypothetical protein